MAFSIAAIMIVKNEQDVLPFVLENTLNQVDKVFIINNDSTDFTEDVIFSFGDRVAYYENKSDLYNHSLWMTFLANLAIESGFDWVVPIDADEFWQNLDELRCMTTCNIIYIRKIRNHMFTNYKGDFHPNKMLFFKEQDNTRIAFRSKSSVVVEEGSHDVHGIPNVLIGESTPIVIDHYPFRTELQYIRKVTNGAKVMNARKTHSSIAWHWKEMASSPNRFKELTARRRFIKLI